MVAGENKGSKLAKAEKLGIKILDKKQFIRLLEEHGLKITSNEKTK